MSKVTARELIKDRMRNAVYEGLYQALWRGRTNSDGPDLEFLCAVIEEMLDIRVKDDER